MPDVVRTTLWPEANHADAALRLEPEWLLTNGLGGYAFGTVAGVLTRRYHGLLIASLPAPLGRIVMLTHLSESLSFPDGEVFHIGGGPAAEGADQSSVSTYLSAFSLENGLPVWGYWLKDVYLEKRIFMVHMQNTVHATYRLLSGSGPVRLELRPLIHFRPHSAPISEPLQAPYQLSI